MRTCKASGWAQEHPLQLGQVMAFEVLVQCHGNGLWYLTS